MCCASRVWWSKTHWLWIPTAAIPSWKTSTFDQTSSQSEFLDHWKHTPMVHMPRQRLHWVIKRASVRPSVHLSTHPSVRPSAFSALTLLFGCQRHICKNLITYCYLCDVQWKWFASTAADATVTPINEFVMKKVIKWVSFCLSLSVIISSDISRCHHKQY